MIRETFGNGFVTLIETLGVDDIYRTVWAGTDDSQPGSPVDFVVSWPTTSYSVAGLRITIDTNHDLGAWEEIDAIQLYGTLEGAGSGDPVLSIGDTTVSESAGSATLTVHMLPTADSTVTVDYATTDGTAVGGADYTVVSGTLTFDPGEYEKTITVSITDDDIREGDETVLTLLSNATGGASISNGVGTLTIENDDPDPTVTIADASAEEGDAVVFTLTLSNPRDLQTTVQYATSDGTATAGDDYTPVTGAATFEPNATTTTISVTALLDTLAEESETFTLTLSDPEGIVFGGADVLTATGTILLNDAGVKLSALDTVVVEGDEGSTDLIVLVSLSSESVQTVTVDYATQDGTATADSDYGAVSGTLEIAAGVLEGTIIVPILGDTLDELLETFTIHLSNPTNAEIEKAIATVSIRDNDGAPTLAIDDATVSESEGTATFTVTRTGASTRVVTVNYATVSGTAQATTDFTPTIGTLTFETNETTKTITVGIVNDSRHEAEERFFVVLRGAQYGTISRAQGVGTIQDDDDATAITIVTPTNGQSFPIGTTSVTLQVAFTNHDGGWRWKRGAEFDPSNPTDGNFVTQGDTATVSGLRSGEVARLTVALTDADSNLIRPLVTETVTFAVGRSVDPNSREFAYSLPQGLSLWSPALDTQFLHTDDRSLNVLEDGGLQARHLIQVGSTIVIRMENGLFETVIGRDGKLLFGDDFAIEAGDAYVVNMMYSGGFVMEGLAHGELVGDPVLSAPSASVSSDATLPPVWAFAVGVTAPATALPDGTALRVVNARTGDAVWSRMDAHKRFLATFADVSHKPVVREGDLLVFVFVTREGYSLGMRTQTRVGADDLRQAFATFEMTVQPEAARLLPNYPNPFNPETWVPFELNEASDVTMRLYSMDGSLVKTLQLGYREAGDHLGRGEAGYWDGRNEFGEPASSGLYLVELRAGRYRAVRRVLLAK